MKIKQIAARTTLALVAGLALLAATGGTTSAATAAAPTRAAAVVPNASLADCPVTYVCFYTGTGESGSMCKWQNADPDWTTQPGVCSWALISPAHSVYNHGTSTAYTAVAFYRGKNYTNYNGCMGQGWHGDIGPVYLLSHRWITTPC